MMQDIKKDISNIKEKQEESSNDIATIKAKTEQNEKLDHETRIRNLEQLANQWLGGKMLFLWIITTALSVYAAAKQH